MNFFLLNGVENILKKKQVKSIGPPTGQAYEKRPS
jgi:hypothetical protein